MFSLSWFQKDRERDRYYLLPGMGGRAYRRKQKVFLQCAIAAGIVVSAVVGILLYMMGR